MHLSSIDPLAWRREAPGQATYTSVSVRADAEAAVPLAPKQSDELQGSARDFIGDQPNADKFYACAFSCAGGSGPADARWYTSTITT